MADQPSRSSNASRQNRFWLRLSYWLWPAAIALAWALLSACLDLSAPMALGLSATALGLGLLLITALLRRRKSSGDGSQGLRPAIVRVLQFWAVCAFAVGLLGLTLR